MAIELERLGTDLWLLDPVDRANDRNGSGDLQLTLRQGVDLATVSGVENMEQALLLRFLTPRGTLEILGHPEYGSRLHTLIGELNNETNRNRAKLYVLEAIAQEPRISRVLAINVTTNRRATPDQIDIELSAEVAESEQIVNMVFPFFLR